jgi:hypothetical protein
VELAAEIAQQRPPLVGERRGEPGRRIERVGDPEELLGLEAAAASCSVEQRRDVVRPADADARSIAQERARLVRLVELAGDDDRVGGRLQALGEPARRRERGGVGQPLADERELEQRLGSSVHADPPSAGAWARDGRMTGDREPPRAR